MYDARLRNMTLEELANEAANNPATAMEKYLSEATKEHLEDEGQLALEVQELVEENDRLENIIDELQEAQD